MNTITIDQIGCLIVRGISLLLAFQVLSTIGVVTYYLNNPQEASIGLWLLFSPHIVNTLLAIVTWVWAPQLSKKMLPVTSESAAPFTLQNMLTVMLVAVGFLLLQDAVKYTIPTVTHIADVMAGKQKLRVSDTLSTVIILGIALSLIFKPQGIARLVNYARAAGGEK